MASDRSTHHLHAVICAGHLTTSPSTGPGDRLLLESLCDTVRDADVVAHPQLGQLVSEDFCWRMSYRDWSTRRPRRWHRRRRRAWLAEGCALRAERQRIRTLARGVGLLFDGVAIGSSRRRDSGAATGLNLGW